VSILGTDVETNARLLANDVDESGWASATGLIFINEGVRDIKDQHPESSLQEDGSLSDYVAMTDLGNTIGLRNEYLIPLVEYYLYRFFGSDAGDTRDKSRSDSHYKRYLDYFLPA